MNVYGRKAVSTALVGIIIVLVIVVAAGGYYVSTLSSGNSTTSHSGTTTITTTPVGATTSTTGSPTTSLGSTTIGTTSTTSSSASTTPTTTATTTFSCGTTYTTGTNTGSSFTIQTVLPFIQGLSAMQVKYNGTSSGSSYNMSASYMVIWAHTSGGVTTYKISVNLDSGGSTQTATAHVQSNGNVLDVSVGGYNATGDTASGIFVGLMAPFLIEGSFLGYLQVYTGQYFHSTGTSTQTFGPTSMQVTSYAANSTPLTFSNCGYSATLNAFNMDVGTVPGTSLKLMTLLHINGNSGGSNYDFTIKVVSLTKA